MARRFTASNAADLVTHTLTAELAPLPTDAWTFGVLWKPNSSHRGGIVKLLQSGSFQLTLNPFDGAGHLFMSVSGSGNDAGDYVADVGEWRQDWFNKPNGTGSILHRVYHYNGDTWDAETDLGSAGDGGAANEDMIVGLHSSGQWLDADMAAMAFYPVVVDTDDIVASDVVTQFQAWRDLATPAGLWKHDQASASDPITDESGNGATGTATGTSIVADPPGFAYESGFSAPLGTAVETSSAITLGRSKVRALGTATETDSAITLAGRKVAALGTAVETDTALELGGAQEGDDVHLGQVMDAIAEQLRTIDGLRVHAYPIARPVPPFAIVSYPERIVFDATYGRGADTMELPLVIAVGKVSDRTARDLLGVYCDGSGVKSVKAVLEAGSYTPTFDNVHVREIEFDVIEVNEVPYMAALFALDIIGSGA